MSIPATYTVRRAGPADLAALVALEQASFSYDRMSPRQYRRHLASPGAAVLLADVEELSYREIADIMGCPIGTVMSRLHRGRRLLKTRLYEHARAMGIVGPEPMIGESEPAQPPAPVDLGAYRARKAAGK